MWSQCDLDGNQYLLLSAIVGHKTDGHKVEKDDKYINVNGRQSMRKTPKGWHLCVKWEDRTTRWERLADVKESNPVQVVEYAKSNGLKDEAAFAWWVPFTLKKRDRIIAAVNKRYHKRTHSLGSVSRRQLRKQLKSTMRMRRRSGRTPLRKR